MRRLHEALVGSGVSVVETREPSNAPFGAVIRQAIEGRIRLSPRSLALAFAGDREDHLTNDVNGINSALDRGAWVLSDRFVLSSLAYQSTAEVEFEWLVELNRHVRSPDVTVFVDTPVDVCLDRISARSVHVELFHTRQELERVHRNYQRAIGQKPFVGHLVHVDGSGAPDVVFAQILTLLRPWLEHQSIAI